ncbi:nuclear transport factor 2 family protein [Altererythrobacter oceanensis]|uniref:Nuclear transport factor 2 family protein n=1 Tax=Qipengyuania oceanensis TaxID=1463597 RepID=A0A844YHI5_9SPHN|nr:nuclear transport factor 2 family protein [Qipengyuania oceanensis]
MSTPRPSLSAEEAEAFAREWIAAWNSGDLERILSHYDDDFEMRSPLIAERGFSSDGCLRGKAAVRPYWAVGLAARPPLHFELIGVHVGVNAIAICYRSVGRARLVVERIQFGEDAKAICAEALYRADPDGA